MKSSTDALYEAVVVATMKNEALSCGQHEGVRFTDGMKNEVPCETSHKEVSQFYSPDGEFYCSAVVLCFAQWYSASPSLRANKISLRMK